MFYEKENTLIPRLLITGTGRSGTGYIAKVLTFSGLSCGHERWWNPYDIHTPGILADASWCALPLGLDDYHGIICHQVRQPLDVITSLVRDPITRHPDYALLHARLVDADPKDLLTYAVRSWITYTEAAEKASVMTWRLDDINTELIAEIGHLADVFLKPAAIVRALNIVTREFNRHHRGLPVTWKEIAEHDPILADELSAAVALRWDGISWNS